MCILSDCRVRKLLLLRYHIFSRKTSAQHGFVQHAIIVPYNPRVGRGITEYEKSAIVLRQLAPECRRFLIFNAVNKRLL